MTDKISTWFEPIRILILAVVGLVWYMATFVSNTNSAIIRLGDDFTSKQELVKVGYDSEIKAIRADVKRNELRNVRLENAIIESSSKLDSIATSLNKVVDSFPYIYATKSEVVMKSQINKQYLNK